MKWSGVVALVGSLLAVPPLLSPPEGARPPTAAGAQSPATSAARPVPELFEPGRVSTGAHDLAIRFSPPMDEMYVVRSGPDWHTAVLCYRRVVNGWRGPDIVRLVPHPIAYPFIAPDGGSLFFDVRRPALPGSGGALVLDLWRAHREGAGWGTPSPLGPAVNSSAVEMHASVAANGNLYFCSNRPGGLGGFDILRATASRDGYEPAQSLGPAVNSPENEYHPFIAPDESYLLFDSRRASGAGGNDLYISVRRPDGGWEPAVPLDEVNTSAGEMRPYVSPDGRRLFFCSDRSIGNPEAPSPTVDAFERRITGPGNGSQDIYWIGAEIVTRRLVRIGRAPVALTRCLGGPLPGSCGPPASPEPRPQRRRSGA